MKEIVSSQGQKGQQNGVALAIVLGRIIALSKQI